MVNECEKLEKSINTTKNGKTAKYSDSPKKSSDNTSNKNSNKTRSRSAPSYIRNRCVNDNEQIF